MVKDIERIKEDIDNIPQLSYLNREELDVLSFYLDRKVFLPNEIICKEGAKGDTLYYILSGLVDVKKESMEGNQTMLNSLGNGASVGEMSIINSGSRCASIVVVKETETLYLTIKHFNEILNKYPVIGIKILRHIATQLCDRLRYLSGRFVDVVEM